MKRKISYLLALVSLAVMTALAVREPPPVNPARAAAAQVLPAPGDRHLIAALGRVEPQSEELRVGAEISGKLAHSLVKEGQWVRRGELLATLENSDLEAQVLSARSRVNEREAEQRRIINGARPQERAEAWAAVKETDAVLESCRGEAERRRGLLGRGAISREEMDRADRAFSVAAARSEAARQHFQFLDSAAREEDTSRAEAALQSARSEVMEAAARLGKTEIRSPINGVVLKQHLKPGESVSPSPDLPVFTLGDTSRLRVRADIDESDIGRIRLGQPVRIEAAAFHDRQFTGRVVNIGRSLGKKNVRTDRAAERADADILEVLIQLDDNRTLPPGLRVDVFITATDATPVEK
jgi:HlyD family secretion protein